MDDRRGPRDRAGDWAEPGSLTWAAPQRERLHEIRAGRVLRGDRTLELLVHRSGRPYASRVRDTFHLRLAPPTPLPGEDWWRSWGPLVWLGNGVAAGVGAAVCWWPTSWWRPSLGSFAGPCLVAWWLDRTPMALWGGRRWPGAGS